METIELSHREILLLSDLLGSEEVDISHELEAAMKDPELDNVKDEMQQDLALCKSIREKLENSMNARNQGEIPDKANCKC